MAGGFHLVSRNLSLGQILRQRIGGASTQFADGDALTITNGILVKAVAAGKVHGILNAMITPASQMRPATELLTTTAGEQLQYIPAMGGQLIFETNLTTPDTPPINGTAVNSGSTTTAVITVATTDGDYTGGTIYFPETDSQHTITLSDDTAGDCTFTFVPPAKRAIGAGDHAIVVPFAGGSSVAVKLSATTASQGISTAVADKTGGQVKIEKVDLKNKKVWVSFPAIV